MVKKAVRLLDCVREKIRIRHSVYSFFLYRHVLELYVFNGIEAFRAKRPQRLPTVLSLGETMAVIDAMSGVFQLIVKMLYGCGLRGVECVRLRAKDVDFYLNEVIVRQRI